MAETAITFDDGADYERFMGVWSRLAGERFLDWLGPQPGLAWLDVGCGNGAFTQLLFDRAAPARVVGVDPSEGQLAFARTRLAGLPAEFRRADATATGLDDGEADAAVMALVLFFVPEPERGVAEMARATRPGGLVCAYAWDVLGGHFPHEKAREVMRELGLPVIYPPRSDAAELAALRALWAGAGLVGVETTVIEVERRFPDFAAFWEASRAGAGARGAGPAPAPETVAELRRRLEARLPRDPDDGAIIVRARANAVRGTKPVQ